MCSLITKLMRSARWSISRYLGRCISFRQASGQTRTRVIELWSVRSLPKGRWDFLQVVKVVWVVWICGVQGGHWSGFRLIIFDILEPLLSKNIAYAGSFMKFVFISVFFKGSLMCLFVYNKYLMLHRVRKHELFLVGSILCLCLCVYTIYLSLSSLVVCG